LPALRTAGADGQSLSDSIAARFRPWFAAAVAGLLLSGFYNYMRHAAAKDVPTMYHMLFGMKFLLALHVFAVGWLSLNRGSTKRARQITGVVVSGLVIIALSAGMRFLALSAMHVITYGPIPNK
jgi:putative copper export protein